jgi:hypothetical protein
MYKLGRIKPGRRAWVVISVLVIVAMLATSIDVVGIVHAANAVFNPPVPPEKKPAEPLTDVAPEPRAVNVRAEEHPSLRIKALGLDKLPKAPAELKDTLPPGWTREMVANPPQSTQALTAPDNAPIVPPNPFEEPPMAVNPERGKKPTDPGRPRMQPTPHQETSEPIGNKREASNVKHQTSK